MIPPTKRRTEQHLIDDEGQALFKRSVPNHWVVREYRPDYGLDFAVEIFKRRSGDDAVVFETLGEHIFVQLKTSRAFKRQALTIHNRMSVEKVPLAQGKADAAFRMDTIAYSLDVSELATIQRMGPALPVMLVLAELDTSTCWFVCLNDYIDKILIPEHGDLSGVQTRTIHVPIVNTLKNEIGTVAFRWYAKRPKLFAAFQKFGYQYHELSYAHEVGGVETLAKHFARILRQYDFWDDTEMWFAIRHLGGALTRFIETGDPGLHRVDEDQVLGLRNPDFQQFVRDFLSEQSVPELWRQLANLPRLYEDICREWFLPTACGVHSSYLELPHIPGVTDS